MTPLKPRDIYDPIYGYIHLDEQEDDILGDPAVQRLRRIRHLGLTNLVYPGAEHTRFAHSLGVVHVVTKLAEALGLKEEVKMLRIAALLHDVGHYPLSHCLETLMEEYDKEAKHEKFAKEVINKTDLGSKIEKLKINVKDLTDLFNGAYKGENAAILNNLISSELDADRIDYLMRDSYNTGIAYGRFDFERILNTLKIGHINGEPRICLKAKAKFAAENYLVARLHMYEAVYIHKNVGAFRIMLNELYKKLVEKKALPDFEKIKEMLSKGRFYCFDDNYVLSKIMTHEFSEPHYKRLQEMLVNRTSLKLVQEAAKPHKSSEGTPEWNALKYIYNDLEAFCKKYGLLPNVVFLDIPSIKASHLSPFLSIAELRGVDTSEYSPAIFMEDDKGELTPLVGDKTSLAHYLDNFNLDLIRIYTFEEEMQKVHAAIEKEIELHQ